MYKLIASLKALIFAACSIATAASAIGQASEEGVTRLSIPYIHGCDETIAIALERLKRIEAGRDVKFSIATIPFDLKPTQDGGDDGIVILEMAGNWVPERFKTRRDYLAITANGIMRSCMPNNGVELSLESVSDLPRLLSELDSKSPLRITKGESTLRIYFNDGTYQLPNPSKQ